MSQSQNRSPFVWLADKIFGSEVYGPGSYTTRAFEPDRNDTIQLCRIDDAANPAETTRSPAA